MDEAVFQPYRAATAIGAHGDSCNDGTCSTYSSTDWLDTNNTIGPLQADKEFNSGSLPSDFTGTNCYDTEQKLPQSQWPLCVIAWKSVMSQSALTTFVHSIPSAQEVVLVFYQEPEGNSFSYCGKTGGPAFVCEYENQMGYVRATGDYPNVLVSMDAGSYQYGDITDDNSSGDETHTNGTGCSFIPPGSYVDVYTYDHYEDTAVGQNIDTEPSREDNWKNWKHCVLPQNKPIGLAEFGLNLNAPTASSTATTLQADNSYLETLYGSTHEDFMLWEYWYAGGWQFTSSSAISEWKAIETQNGGG